MLSGSNTVCFWLWLVSAVVSPSRCWDSLFNYLFIPFSLGYDGGMTR